MVAALKIGMINIPHRNQKDCLARSYRSDFSLPVPRGSSTRASILLSVLSGYDQPVSLSSLGKMTNFLRDIEDPKLGVILTVQAKGPPQIPV